MLHFGVQVNIFIVCFQDANCIVQLYCGGIDQMHVMLNGLAELAFGRRSDVRNMSAVYISTVSE